MAELRLPPPAEYNEFLKDVDVLGIRMTMGSFESKAPRVQQKETTVNVAMRSQFVNLKGKFEGVADFKIDFKNDDSGELVGEILASYMVTYTSTKPMTEEIWQIFSERNLRLNLWPYLREFVDTSTGRMAWPRLVLPAMNSARARKRRKDEEKPKGSATTE